MTHTVSFPCRIFLVILCYAGTVQAQQPAAEDINAPYKASDLDVQVWVERFEVEGREVYDQRNAIVAALGLRPGQVVADVGAGTGLFIPLLANQVGLQGTVYAVEIAPGFITHIEQQARQRGLTQVKTILNGERTAGLPERAIDVVFTSDVYHHFTYHQDMLASIRAALRPEGRLVVVDYDKVPGKSSEFVMQHIRDTKEVFTAEIEAAGFKLAEEVRNPGFKETFMRIFIKRETIH